MSDDLVRTWGNWHRENDHDQRKVWQRWLKMHGIDPDLVANSQAMLMRRPERYQIAYATWAGIRKDGDRGALHLDTYVDEDGHHHPVRITRIFQMEAPPLPFPV